MRLRQYLQSAPRGANPGDDPCLRNNTRALLDRVASGESVTITVNGRAVAVLTPVSRRPRWLARGEFVRRIQSHDRVSESWARLRWLLRDSGPRMPVNDSWIAATATSLGIPVITQDRDYVDIPGLDVIRV